MLQRYDFLYIFVHKKTSVQKDNSENVFMFTNY